MWSRIKAYWHRLLVALEIRNDFDWAPPCLGPEVNHPYYKSATLRCCDHCGGGFRHAIHSKPYNERRALEVAAIETERRVLAFRSFVEREQGQSTDVRAFVEQYRSVPAKAGDVSDPGTDYTGI